MPLHLLGKKSWNVYNPENIAKVRRDEAEAAAKEETEERRMQEVDADLRLQRLRGTHTAVVPGTSTVASEKNPLDYEQPRKRRRIAGEDDTDRDIRWALEDAAAASTQAKAIHRGSKNEPLTDLHGHINLFPEDQKQRSGKNEEAQAEAAKRRKGLEDQYTMRFSNAAGSRPGSDKPWYTDSTQGGISSEGVPSKDVWGNEDPGRQARERSRLSSGDPLAAIKKGVKQLREAEKHRTEWRQQRERDLNEVEELARRHRKRRSSDRSLENFDLDIGYKDKARSRRHRHSSSHRAHRHDDRDSPGQSRHRKRHHVDVRPERS